MKTSREHTISPVYTHCNSYIDSVVYVEGFPNSSTKVDPGPSPSTNCIVDQAIVGSAVLQS